MSAASPHRGQALFLILAGTTLSLALWWGVSYRPRLADVSSEEVALAADRRAMAATRAEILRLGEHGIAARIQQLRGEVQRREALAPTGPPEAAASSMRERFATLASRYGVHAPTFEIIPPATARGMRTEGFRVRAAGQYHDLGTWAAEALSADRLVDVRSARLQVVPDSLLRTLLADQAASAPAVSSVPNAAPVPGAPHPAATALEIAGARPLDAVLEMEVQWYALDVSPPRGISTGPGVAP